MKYFTAEMWAGWQSDSAAVEKRTDRLWARNSTMYRRKLLTLAPRLGASNGRFFTQHSLHDGNLVRFAIKDWPASNLRKGRMGVNQTSVEIVVLPYEEKAKLFRLNYSGIQDISVRTSDDLFPTDGSKFGDWGYDELLPEGKRFFRHNILFQTGTEVSIVFRKFSFRQESSTKRAIKHYADL